MSKQLTPKQKHFCDKYIELGNKTEAYKQSYSASDMKDSTINSCVKELFRNPLITTYIINRQEELSKSANHDIDAANKLDLGIVNDFISNLKVLSNPDAKEKDVEVAFRVLKCIGANGLNGAQDRLSKRLGFFDKHNRQKSLELVVQWHEEKTYSVTLSE